MVSLPKSNFGKDSLYFTAIILMIIITAILIEAAMLESILKYNIEVNSTAPAIHAVA